MVKDPRQLLASKPLFDQYLAQSPARLSAYHFSSLFAWSDFFDFSFELIDARLCIFAHHAPGSFLYLPPLGGQITLDTIAQCLSKMKGSRPGVARIENVDAKTNGLCEGQRYISRKKADEYLYRKADIMALSGHAYKSQRHDVNHATQAYAPNYQPYVQDEHFKSCVALYERWAQDRAAHCTDQVYRAMLEDNRLSHARILAYHDELGVTGRVLTVAGEVAAYSFGYPLNCDTFCVLLEVTDLSKTGLAATMFQRFCADAQWATHTWVNAMDDFGMPNIARAKKAYHPVELIPSFTIYQD